MSRKLNKQTKGVAKVFYPWFSVKTPISFEAKNVRRKTWTIFRREMYVFYLFWLFSLFSIHLTYTINEFGTEQDIRIVPHTFL